MFSFAVFLGGKETCWRVCKRENFVQLVEKWWKLFDKTPERHIYTRPRSKAHFIESKKGKWNGKHISEKSFIIMAFYDYFCLLLFCYFTVFNVILA